jgi:hypothetical protein
MKFDIPRELAEDFMQFVRLCRDQNWPSPDATIDRLHKHLKAQLHPPREPRVGDVLVSNGAVYIGQHRPDEDVSFPGIWWLCCDPNHTWSWAGFGHPEEYLQFNILDELEARKEGPVVVLTQEAAYYLKDYCVNRDPDLGRRIDEALADYRPTT